ncbi:MAG: hypothetical protein Ct9H300mP28_24300 [Pseudomonadota bacterium]|nr:MAG: hypothetical protein Ct9H300mP28_24300 [Pseudomonadota bacterium]
MILVSAATESVKKKFFSERLSTLFSSNYRVYLMLKNRYFLHRLKRSENNPAFNELQKVVWWIFHLSFMKLRGALYWN